MSTHEDIESSAASADLTRAEDVSRLTEAVLAYTHTSILKAPSDAVSLLQAKVEAAEARYWQHATQGVTENDLVAALNGICDALKLPEHTRTTATQVREFRMRVLLTFPRLMGLRMGRKDSSGKLQLNEEMSPLQATHVFLSLMDAKVSMPEYQVTPAEWENARKQRTSTGDAEKSGGEKWSIRTSNTPRTYEVYKALNEALDRTSEAEGLALALKTLKHLGVE